MEQLNYYLEIAIIAGVMEDRVEIGSNAFQNEIPVSFLQDHLERSIM